MTDILLCRGTQKTDGGFVSNGARPGTGSKLRDYPTITRLTYDAPIALRDDPHGLHAHYVYGNTKFSESLEAADLLAPDAESTWECGAIRLSAGWGHPLYHASAPDDPILPVEKPAYSVNGAFDKKSLAETPGGVISEMPDGFEMTGRRGGFTWAAGKPNVLIASVQFPEWGIPGVLSHRELGPQAKFNDHVSYKKTKLHTARYLQYTFKAKFEIFPEAWLAGKTEAEIQAKQAFELSQLTLSTGALSTLHEHYMSAWKPGEQKKFLDTMRRGGDIDPVDGKGQQSRKIYPERLEDEDGDVLYRGSSRMLNPRMVAGFPPVPASKPIDVKPKAKPKPPVDTPPAEDPPTDLPDNITALDLINQARGIMDRLEVEVRKG